MKNLVHFTCRNILQEQSNQVGQIILKRILELNIFYTYNMKGRNTLGELGVNWRIILKLILLEKEGVCLCETALGTGKIDRFYGNGKRSSGSLVRKISPLTQKL
jgi:hypothetical protein